MKNGLVVSILIRENESKYALRQMLKVTMIGNRMASGK